MGGLLSKALAGAAKGGMEAFDDGMKSAMLMQREQALAKLKSRAEQIKPVRTSPGDTLVRMGDGGKMVETYANPNQTSVDTKLDPATRAQIDMYKNVTSTLSRVGEFGMDRTTTDKLQRERKALEQVLVAKGLLPRVEGGSRESFSDTRSVIEGSFEPDEADIGSEWLGMEYGDGEIDSMVSQARGRVEAGKYQNREELARSLEGRVEPKVVLQILDRVFPKNGLLQSEAQPAAIDSSPPLNRLTEGRQTQFENGQVWTLRNGQPIRIQ